MPDMTSSELIQVTRIDGVLIVRFYDLWAVSWDSDRTENLDSELSAVADHNPRTVILDFEGKDFCPAATIEHVFVKLQKKLGKNLRMCNLPVMATEHFDMNRLSTWFQIHPTLEDSITAVKSSAGET